MRWHGVRWVIVLAVAALCLLIVWPAGGERVEGEDRANVAAPADQAPRLEAGGAKPFAAWPVPAAPSSPDFPPELPPEIERRLRIAARDPKEPWQVAGTVRDAKTGDAVRVALRLVNDLPSYARNVELRGIVHTVDVSSDGSFRYEIDPKVLPAPLFLSGSPEWMVVGDRHAWSSRELPEDRPFVVQVVRTFYVSGRVMGNTGDPLRAFIGYPLSLNPGEQTPLGFFYGAGTDEEGRFVAGPLPVDRAQWPTELRDPCPTFLTVTASDHAGARFDPWALSPEEREELVITLDAGVAVSGVVVDASGRPLSDMPVLAEDLEGLWYWPTHTDDRGAFNLEHVPNRPVTVRAWDFERDIEGRVRLQVKAPKSGVQVVVRPIELSAPPHVYWVCGLGLIEVDPEIRERYGVVPDAGVLIYDPGSATALKRGHGVTGANFKEVRSIKEILQLLLAAQEGSLGPMLSISWRDPHSISHFSHKLSIGEKDRTALSSLLESLR